MEFIKSNWGIIFSGFGVTLLLIIGGLILKPFAFFRTHKIIKKSELDELQKIKFNYIDLDELKKGLEYNHKFGIYVDKNNNESFCPLCIDNKKIKNHLYEEETEFGVVYVCKVCPQIFRDKGFQQRVQEANKQENYFWQ